MADRIVNHDVAAAEGKGMSPHQINVAVWPSMGTDGV